MHDRQFVDELRARVRRGEISLSEGFAIMQEKENVDHPAHYGGDVMYEVIKVIENWDLGFRLGSVIKYIARAGKKGDDLEDLEKALWYLKREIQSRKGELPWEDPKMLFPEEITGSKSIAEIRDEMKRKITRARYPHPDEPQNGGEKAEDSESVS